MQLRCTMSLLGIAARRADQLALHAKSLAFTGR